MQGSASEGLLTTADGVRLFWQRQGRGERTLLVPNALYMRDDFAFLAEEQEVVFFDLRNRGRSEPVEDPARLERGVLHDVDDLEAVRRHCGRERVALLAHSYPAVSVALYAQRHPARVERLVQLGPPPPAAATVYPPQLTGADAVLAEIGGRMARLQQEAAGRDPESVRREMWALMRQLYVTDPADAERITWRTEGVANESFAHLMPHLSRNIFPSLNRLALSAADFAPATMPVLVVHGTRDRQSPYGGGRDWARRWPQARLLTVEGGAHLSWIEAPELVREALRTFLAGAWPAAARPVGTGDSG